MSCSWVDDKFLTDLVALIKWIFKSQPFLQKDTPQRKNFYSTVLQQFKHYVSGMYLLCYISSSIKRTKRKHLSALFSWFSSRESCESRQKDKYNTSSIYMILLLYLIVCHKDVFRQTNIEKRKKFPHSFCTFTPFH